MKYSIRTLLKAPAFTITGVAALALGIGATTAVFSLVNAVLLKPAPVPDPDRFVMLTPVGTPDKLAYWRGQQSVLQDVSAYMPGMLNYTGGEDVEQLASMQVSADALRCWGTPILRGRGFTPQEDAPGGARVALLGEDFWRRRFAADSQILGKTVSLSGAAYTVIGIAANSPFLMEQGTAPDVYVPFQLDPNWTDQTVRFRVTARLTPGVTLEQANARLRASTAAYRASFPRGLGPRDVFSAVPYRDFEAGGNGPLLMALLGAVGLVLLIACANVANLLLVRGEGRRREIAIRMAIGATRGRIVRQLLSESLLLSLAGGGLGLLLGFIGVRALLAVNTAGLPRLGDSVGLDWRVVIFAVGVSLLTGIVFGLFPAFAASRAVTQPRRSKIRAALVVSEVGLAVILLVGSALLIRTIVALYSVDRGFDTANVITMRMRMTRAETVSDSIRGGLERIRALPGVQFAGATYFIPLQTAIGSSFDIVGRPPERQPATGWAPVAAGYFEALGIPVKRGRTFTDRDDEKSPPVVIINESMAKQYWRDADPLRDRILIGRDSAQWRGPARQIIGIAGDVRDRELSYEPRPTMYVPQAQITDAMNALLVRIQPVAWIVRTRDEPHALVPAIREQLRQATGLPVSDVRSMDEVVALSTARQRFNMLLMTVFASMALLLAEIGIYGLMSFAVAQRRREIGIRLALGAESSRVRNMVVRQGMALAMAGAALGLGGAWALARLIRSVLFGVTAHDPAVFIAVPAALAAVALLAVWLPAVRASRVNPLDALRYE